MCYEQNIDSCQWIQKISLTVVIAKRAFLYYLCSTKAIIGRATTQNTPTIP